MVISGSGSINNSGTISGAEAGFYGVRFSNTAAGTYTTTFSNSDTGEISGGGAGLSINFSNASAVATNTIINGGSITATNASGLLIQGTGNFTNTVTNSGLISSTTYGAQLNTGTLINSGAIQGQTLPSTLNRLKPSRLLFRESYVEYRYSQGLSCERQLPLFHLRIASTLPPPGPLANSLTVQGIRV